MLRAAFQEEEAATPPACPSAFPRRRLADCALTRTPNPVPTLSPPASLPCASYGADAVCPYVAYDAMGAMAAKEGMAPSTAMSKYQKAVSFGILKVRVRRGEACCAGRQSAAVAAW